MGEHRILEIIFVTYKYKIIIIIIIIYIGKYNL